MKYLIVFMVVFLGGCGNPSFPTPDYSGAGISTQDVMARAARSECP